MKLIFNRSVLTDHSKSIIDYSADYLNMFSIDLDNLIKNEYLYRVKTYLNNDIVDIEIYVDQDRLYNIIINNNWIPCYNSLISILNIYRSEISKFDLSYRQLNSDGLSNWICCLDNKINNHICDYRYYDENVIEISDKLYYNKSSGNFLTNPPLKHLKSYNGGCIIDTLGIKNKKELYTIIKRPTQQTNGTVLKKIYNGFKMNRFITSDKTLLICPPKMQKSLKQKIKYSKSIILTTKNYNKLTLNDINNVKVVICSYNFLNSLIPSRNKTEIEINNNIYAQIYTLFNKPPKINPFIIYWDKVILFNYDHLFKPNNCLTNRIHILLKIIESVTQWIFLNNEPEGDDVASIIKQLFRSENIPCINSELIDNLFVQKQYNGLVNKNIISDQLELTMKEQIILNSNAFSNSEGFKSNLEKNYPLLFGDVVVDFKFFDSVKDIEKHIMTKMKNKIIKYDKLISKLERGESIEYNYSVLKRKISEVNSKIKYFNQLFLSNKTCCEEGRDGSGEGGSGEGGKGDRVFGKEVDCCPICYTDIDNNSIAITKCGHVFCYYCILQSIILSNFNYIKCPKCREKLRLEKIYAINKEDDLLSEHGIKIGKLVNTLKKSDHKIVVLSKWGTILKYLKDVFNTNLITTNKYLLLSYNQLDRIEKRYKTCIMLDPPPVKYKKEKINYHCDSIIKYTLIGSGAETEDNNVIEL